MDFYDANIKPQFEYEEKARHYKDFDTIKRIRDKVNGSSLGSERVFESLYAWYNELERQEATKKDSREQ